MWGRVVEPFVSLGLANLIISHAILNMANYMETRSAVCTVPGCLFLRYKNSGGEWSDYCEAHDIESQQEECRHNQVSFRDNPKNRKEQEVCCLLCGKYKNVFNKGEWLTQKAEDQIVVEWK